jgi:hypothetical protein
VLARDPTGWGEQRRASGSGAVMLVYSKYGGSLMKFGPLALALALACPSMAFAACERPSPPGPVDGAALSMDELVAAQKSVMAFMSASDAYQTCILEDLTAQRDAAKKAKTKLDPAVEKAADDAVSANQADKEQVGAAYNAAVKAHKAAHPS